MFVWDSILVSKIRAVDQYCNYRFYCYTTRPRNQGSNQYRIWKVGNSIILLSGLTTVKTRGGVL